MSIAILAAIVATHPSGEVIASRVFDADHHRTVAQLVKTPEGTSAEAFARTLIEASGLTPWNGEFTHWPAARGKWGGIGVASRSGPEATIYFMLESSHGARPVCRIARERGGITEAWTKAQDWCAAHLGVQPLQRESPVGTLGNQP